MNYWSEGDVKYNKELGVKVLFHATNVEVTDTVSLPSNTYIIGIEKDNKVFDDIAQGTMSDIFNAYYDKFGSQSILYIRTTKGRCSPSLFDKIKKDKKK